MNVPPDVEARAHAADVASARRTLTLLQWWAADPWAVRIEFVHEIDEDGVPIAWGFARETLDGGLTEHTGEGDIRFWPDGPDLIAMALSSPDGHAILHLPRPRVAVFLARTYLLVPAGCESLVSDQAIDGLLDDWMAGA